MKIKHSINSRKTTDKTSINQYQQVRDSINRRNLEKKKSITSKTDDLDKISTTRPLKDQI